jgi:Domain of unknown function (DUF4407)
MLTVLSAQIEGLTRDTREMLQELNQQPRLAATLDGQAETCKLEAAALEVQRKSLYTQLTGLDRRISLARSQQNERLAGNLRRSRNQKQAEVSRTDANLQQKRSECEGLDQQVIDAEKSHAANLNSLIQKNQRSIEQKSAQLAELKTQADQKRTGAESQAKLGFGRNLSAEYAALARLLSDPDETGARLTAMIVALFFGLIDVTPVLWGWSLRGGGVDVLLAQRADTYLRSIALAQESIARQFEAEDAANAAYNAVRGAEEMAHRERRARFEARLAAAKQYADAVTALEKMLTSERHSGTSSDIIERVRHESVEALSTTFRAAPAPQQA